MYEIIKSLSDGSKLAYSDSVVWMLKRISHEDIPVYEKLAGIKNENIASVKETVVIDNKIYAAREYIQGVTLDEFIVKNFPLDDETVSRIAIDVCSGLSEIHKLGIIHRDIKPSNIIINASGTAVIIDFGISRIYKENTVGDTQILGTQGFAAPEQFGFSQTDDKADIYAVGVLINYMKTKALPNEKLADAPFDKIVLKATEIDRKNRYADVEDMANALKGKPLKNKHSFGVPGFRSRTPKNMIIASAYYFFYLLFNLSVFSAKSENFTRLQDILMLFFIMLVPVPIITEWGDWMNRIKGSKRWSKKEKITLKLVITSIIVLTASFIIL